MVYQKKGPMKGKQQTPAKLKGKKAFEEKEDDDLGMDFNAVDSDDNDSDDSDEQVVMTPASKALKGKQPQSDKKVSFQIPGKNTPKSENSALAKKPTPGKMSIKEFQGMLANKNGKAAKRPAENDSDDDDDDDDDEDDDDDNADLDMMLGDDDDEDDDDDDDDEDDEDDDDDDDDDEEEDESPKKKQNAKQLNQSKTDKAKTPVKNLEKTPAKKGDKTPVQMPAKKDKTPSKEAVTPGKNSVSPKSTPDKKFETAQLGKAKKLEADTRRERDLRTLYVGNLPKDVTVTELKALSADIVNAILPHSVSHKKKKNIFGFLEFASEAKAEENYKILQKKKLRNEPLQLDFAGEKSKRAQSVSTEQSEKQHNLRRLYVASIPIDATMEQISKFFPKCYQITLNTSSQFRTATVNYVNEKDAAEDLEKAQGAKISGMLLTVLYSVLKISNKQKKRKNQSTKQQASKKIKLEVKQEESDDDDDDDDDDE